VRLAFLVYVGCLIVGCSTVTMRGADESLLSLGHDEAIVVIMSSHRNIPPKKTSSSFMAIETCVAETIREVSPSLRVVMADEFRHTAFPGLDFEEIPRSQEYILLLLKNQQFSEAVASHKVRYLLLMTGNTTDLMNKSGDIVCGAGYGGGGCLGLAVWDKTSSLQASIIDVKHASPVGDFEVSVTGKPWLAVVGIVPVGLPSFPEHMVCEELGKAVAKTMKVDDASLSHRQREDEPRR
jgi:hypothetical protein